MSLELWASKDKIGSEATISKWFYQYMNLYSKKGDWPFKSFSEFKAVKLFSVLEYQLNELEKRGCKFVLIAEGSKVPLRGTTWKKTSVPVDKVLRWIRQHRGNVAVVSRRSNVFVVDLDPELALIDGEYREINPLWRKHSSKLTKATRFWLPWIKETFCVRTPRGIHLWFQASEVTKEQEDRLDDLNVRSDIFRKGNQYELIPPSEITVQAIDDANRRAKEFGREKMNWKEGSYSYIDFSKPFLPLERVLH